MEVPVADKQLVEWIHRIQGKTVVITGLYGSSHGVGKETALLCAAKGAKVVVADWDQQALGAVLEAIKATGGIAASKVTDVRRPEQVEDLFKYAVSIFGRVDVVVNVVGLGGEEGVEISEDDQPRFFDPESIGIHHATSVGLQFLQNTESDLKSMVLINTPGFGGARLKVAAIIKGLVPLYADKGIKLGYVYPWFPDSAKIPPKLKAMMGPQARPPLPRVAIAALYIATDPEHNGCQLILTDSKSTDMVEYGSVEKLKAQFAMAKAAAKDGPGEGGVKASPIANMFAGGSLDGAERPKFELPDGWQKYVSKGKEIIAKIVSDENLEDAGTSEASRKFSFSKPEGGADGRKPSFDKSKFGEDKLKSGANTPKFTGDKPKFGGGRHNFGKSNGFVKRKADDSSEDEAPEVPKSKIPKLPSKLAKL